MPTPNLIDPQSVPDTRLEEKKELLSVALETQVDSRTLRADGAR